jgi:hypothetical protein
MSKAKLQWDIVFAWSVIVMFLGVFWWEVIYSSIHIIQKHR